MKIRQGFVSNSSTTSFCIYGAQVAVPYDEEKEETEEYYDSHEDMEELCDKNGLEFHSTPWGDNPYVGVEWCNIGDDETANQFKARIEGKLFEVFGTRPEACGTFEEAWRDG